MERYNAMTEKFQKATIFGIPAMFSNARIDRKTVPEGYHLYEVRHDDDCQGDAVQIGRNIFVNHWGSLLMRDELELSHVGLLDIKPEDINYCAGDLENMVDFMKWYPIERISS